MARLTLDELLAESDDLGLLDVKPRPVNTSTEAVRIQQAFEEINVFVDRQHYAPGEGQAGERVSVNERTLQVRLKTYRENPAITEQLREFDRHGLLAQATEALPPASLDDILDLDDELLSESAEDIFTFRHARPAAARPDKISERKPCGDFAQFKPLFDQAAADLVTGKRKSMKFANEQEIEAGGFFILHGVMVYVAEVNDPHIRNGKRNARLRLIFENGTEGKNLLRSLATELYKDPSGRRLSEPNAGPLFDPAPTFTTEAGPNGHRKVTTPVDENARSPHPGAPSPQSSPASGRGSERENQLLIPESLRELQVNERITGCIYIVRSLPPSPEIAKLDGQLFKIGFTTGSFEDRIRGAKDDPTFLMAPVHPVRSYDAINLNANKFESLMHRFFADARLDIEIMDRFGKPFRPREWFLLPLPVIETAIAMLLDGSILRHRYDAVAGEIVSMQPHDLTNDPLLTSNG
ncbi:MAG: GIY-YIG nuclease family protein [Nitrosomonadales bacterium]|nr:GIY-YIG nuclease family protein [Nitrosomonadales bacterium]